MDLADLFRVFNPERRSFTYFGLDHVASVWLGVPRHLSEHDALLDAFHSMSLFNSYRTVQHDPVVLYGLQTKTLRTPVSLGIFLYKLIGLIEDLTAYIFGLPNR